MALQTLTSAWSTLLLCLSNQTHLVIISSSSHSISARSKLHLLFDSLLVHVGVSKDVYHFASWPFDLLAVLLHQHFFPHRILQHCSYATHSTLTNLDLFFALKSFNAACLPLPTPTFVPLVCNASKTIWSVFNVFKQKQWKHNSMYYVMLFHLRNVYIRIWGRASRIGGRKTLLPSPHAVAASPIQVFNLTLDRGREQERVAR